MITRLLLQLCDIKDALLNNAKEPYWSIVPKLKYESEFVNEFPSKSWRKQYYSAFSDIKMLP